MINFYNNSTIKKKYFNEGIDFIVRTLKIEENIVKIQIWDTASQERFFSITQTYYKSAVGIFLAYAIDDKQSFDDLDKWIDNVKTYSSESAVIILLGFIKNDICIIQKIMYIKR